MTKYFIDLRPKMWDRCDEARLTPQSCDAHNRESIGYTEVFDDVEKLKKVCPEKDIMVIAVED